MLPRILLWVATPKLASSYTPIHQRLRDGPLSADRIKGADDLTEHVCQKSQEAPLLVEFKTEVVNPMAKRRAAEQLVMAQVKSYAQRCRTRAKLYCVGDQHSATHKRNGIWDTAEGVCHPESPSASTTRTSVASTAASCSTEDERDVDDVGMGEHCVPTHNTELNFGSLVSEEALLRTTVLRSNAVDFSLKFAKTVEMLEKSLRLRKPIRRRSVCGATDKWISSDDIDLRLKEARLWSDIQCDGSDHVD